LTWRIAVLILAVVVPWPAARGADVNDFIDFSIAGDRTQPALPGRLYVPPEATASPRPLILFLHGAGESGSNNVSQINQNIDNLLAEAKERGAFLFAPQTNSGWSDTGILTRTASLLDRALVDHNVDVSRLYVTGLSMGGGGVWNILHRNPDRFAAAVPIAAVSPATGFLSANLLDDSIWAIHARDDAVVSPNSSRNVVSGIVRAAGEAIPTFPSLADRTTLFHFDSERLDLHYTELPAGGHGIWFSVYAHEPLYDWMFAHAVVPEPASILLVALASVIAGSASRRSRHARASRSGAIQIPGWQIQAGS
jgi:predicted peptidase